MLRDLRDIQYPVHDGNRNQYPVSDQNLCRLSVLKLCCCS
jgi:hypothetical protein